jgi:glycosyltransferase involved in cell wall biosynthesis
MMPDVARVAIDCRTLQDRPLGGVGRSVQGQLPHLADAMAVSALVDSRLPAPLGLPESVAVSSLRGPFTSRGFAWLQVSAPRWLRRFDGLFHCPFYGLPYHQPVPMVVTIHDLSFEFAPQWFPRSNRIMFQLQARWAARTARRILVHSEHVRQMVLERYAGYGVTDDQVLAVHMPVDPRFSPDTRDLDANLQRFGITQPYVIALGGAARRRLGTAIDAWAYARSQLDATAAELQLVVVGTEKPPVAQPGVVYVGPLPDHAWAALLSGAAAFCYATGYEGFGMPALEAAASGTPLVCGRVGSLPEILGEDAAWSEGESAAQLGAALAQVLGDPALAAQLRAGGIDRACTLPTWSDVAGVTLRAYREALAR